MNTVDSRLRRLINMNPSYGLPILGITASGTGDMAADCWGRYGLDVRVVSYQKEENC